MKLNLRILISLFFLFASCVEKENPVPALIPMPQQLEWAEGNLKFTELVIGSESQFSGETKALEKFFSFAEIESPKTVEIILIQQKVNNPHNIEGAYELRIGKSIEIKAENATGIFYGIQTLGQLAQKNGNTTSIPKCVIKDWPAFKIRGFMHDVGRNYISVKRLKEHLDIMAAYKYNVFHMHLTDNPGWRLESKLYPDLQSEEATLRKPGKFYSQKEFKDLVEFCKERHITIIPELDVPGHTQAFRKAFNLESMNSPKVQKIILILIEELCTLAPAEEMPYIHLGTDEVRQKAEHVDRDYLLPLIRKIEQNNRTYISWWHGIKTPGDTSSIKQLWAQSEPLEGHPYIDSRSNYINHLDPLAAISQLYFQQPCRAPHGDYTKLGGILCSWPDNRVDNENDIFRQNPIYPALVAYSEAIWCGVKKSTGQQYWAQLPDNNTEEYKSYLKFESRVIEHRNKYFKGLEFPFLKNAQIPWKIIGPFNHAGDLKKSFEVEKEIKSEYLVDGKSYKWNEPELHGGTVHLKHFFGFPSPIKEKEGTVYALNYIWSPKEQEVGFWIGFHGWSRAGGRRGGPTPQLGQWHTTDPKIWVNDKEIAPPVWKQPGLAKDTPEVPFIDEDYFYREPTKIGLKKGWNKFLLKVPHGGTSWKWMFTCIPVLLDGNNVREVEGLKYSTAHDDEDME